MNDIRKQVRAQIIETMRTAQESGQDAYKAAEQTYPDTPYGVLCECLVELDYATEEAWWKTIEKTIDGEVVRAALLKNGAK